MRHFLLFDPTLVKLVESDQRAKIPEYVSSVYPEAYTGGSKDLRIVWIPEGMKFRVCEYDGNEYIEAIDTIDWEIA